MPAASIELAISSNCAIFPLPVTFKGFLQLLIHSSFMELAFKGLSDEELERPDGESTVDDGGIAAVIEILLFFVPILSDVVEIKFRGKLFSFSFATSDCCRDFITTGCC